MKVVRKLPEEVKANREFLLGHLYENSSRLYIATTDYIVDLQTGTRFHVSYIDVAYFVDVTDNYCIKEGR